MLSSFRARLTPCKRTRLSYDSGRSLIWYLYNTVDMIVSILQTPISSIMGNCPTTYEQIICTEGEMTGHPNRQEIVVLTRNWVSEFCPSSWNPDSTRNLRGNNKCATTRYVLPCLRTVPLVVIQDATFNIFRMQ